MRKITSSVFAITLLAFVTSAAQATPMINLTQGTTGGGNDIFTFDIDNSVSADTYDTIDVTINATTGTFLNPSNLGTFVPGGDDTAFIGSTTVATGRALVGIASSGTSLSGVVTTFGGPSTDSLMAAFAQVVGAPGLAGDYTINFANAGAPVLGSINGTFGGGVVDMLVPDVANGSTIDLSDAYRNSGGSAPGAINFTGNGTITSATVGTQSIADLFGASINGLSIDLSVDTGIGGTFPAGTGATGVLSIATSNGESFSYDLTATVPEPASLALIGLALVGLAATKRS